MVKPYPFWLQKYYYETNSEEQSPSLEKSIGSVTEDIPRVLLNPKFQNGAHKD
jgi:hypothetical protein